MGDTTLDLGLGDDSFGLNNALKIPGLPGGGGGGRRRAEAQFPALKPEEAAPLRQKLLDTTVSGLHYLGSSLDKAFGARALRGLAAGKPHELLSAVPFSDTMGLTKPEDSVSMDQLLQHHNLVKPNDPSKWELRDFAVPALEIAADPGTWLMPMGALSKAGKLAKGLGQTQGFTRKALTEGYHATEPALRALGHTTESIAHLENQGRRIARQPLLDAAAARGMTIEAGQPLRGALGVGLPFRDASFTLGHGKFAQGLAGAQDYLGGKVAATAAGSKLRQLFDPDVMRAEHPTVQGSAAQYGTPAKEAMESITRGHEHELYTQLDKIMAGFKGLPAGTEGEALRAIRGMAEGSPHFADHARYQADLMRRHGVVTGPGRTLAPGVVDPQAVATHIASNWHHLTDMGQRVRTFGQDILRNAQDAGVHSGSLDDFFADYAARRYIGANPTFGGKDVGKLFPTTHGSNMARKTSLKGIPGATPQLDEWAMNPALAGPRHLLPSGPSAVQSHVLQQMVDTSVLAKGGPLTIDEMKVLGDKAKQVQGWLETVPSVHYEHGLPYFNPDIIGDLAMRGQRHAGVTGSAAASIDAMSRLSQPTADLMASGAAHVPLGDFVATGGRAGLNTGVRDLGAGPEFHGAGMRLWEKMAPQGFGPVAQAQAANPGQKLAYWQEKLNEHALTEENAAAIAKYLGGWTKPEELKPILGSFAGAQQLFKNMVYPLWPASHFRNLTSAVYNNFLHGHGLGGLGDYGDAGRILKEGVVKDPRRYAQTAALTPEAAGYALKKGAYADAKVGSGISSFDDFVGGQGLNSDRLTRGFSGQERLTRSAPGVHEPLLDQIKRHGLGGFNPLGQAGIGGGWIDKLFRTGRTTKRTEDTFTPLLLGRATGTAIEDRVRLANYLGNLRKGMDSARAGQLTRDIHFDYSKLTPFESNVMKPLIPFYTFMRNNLPYQANMVATRPGSVTPALRMMGATDPNAPWVPEHLASGAARAWGPEHDGEQRYVSSFGTPLEEAAGRFKFKNYETPWGGKVGLPAPLATAGAFIGEMSPYFKAPLEAIADHSFKSGRQLTDMQSNRLLTQGLQMPEEYAQPLTQILANSPMARFMTTGQSFADDRKGIDAKASNFLTGVRLTDPVMARERYLEQKRQLEARLKADPRVSEFVNFSVRDPFKANPGADLTADLRLRNTMQRDAKAYFREQEARQKLKALYGGGLPGL